MNAPTKYQLMREVTTARAAGRFAEALAASEQVVAAEPKDLMALCVHAAILRDLGRAEEARAVAHRATVLNPTLIAAHIGLGLALIDLGRVKEAEKAFERALKFNSREPEALAGLGRIRLQQGRFAEAESCLADAIRARPRDARLFLLFGDILAAQNKTHGMVQSYRRARDTDPGSSEAVQKYADAMAAIGGPDAAGKALQEAVDNAPQSVHAQMLLGHFLAGHGRLDEALGRYRAARAIDPDHDDAHASIARVKSFTSRDDADFVALEDAYARRGADQAHTGISYARAKALDDLKDYGPAFDALLEANRMRRAEIKYSFAPEVSLFAGIRKTFTAEFIARNRGHGHDSDAPIFVLGMPRSGTTLTETILSRSPGVFAAGELDFIRRASTEVVGASPIDQSVDFGHKVKPADFAAIGERYLSHLASEARAARHVTDKMPHNFRVVALIRLVFPNARIIHVNRDPMDNCLSIYKANFGAPGLGFSFDLTDLGHYYNLYRGLMRHWRKVLPGEFYELSYEALVTEPEATTRALFDYCGLEWSPDVIHVEQSKREVRTASVAQVRRPINSNSVSSADRYGSRLDPLRAALAEWNETDG